MTTASVDTVRWCVSLRLAVLKEISKMPVIGRLLMQTTPSSVKEVFECKT